MQGYELIDFQAIGDERGWLVVIEGNKNIPFDVKRVYYIYDTQNEIIRGKHAHRKLQQIIFCPKGSCDFILDDGKERTIVRLDTPHKGLYIKSNLWREFTNFSKDCVVMVLASEHYDESDYIRNYDDFLELVNA